MKKFLCFFVFALACVAIARATGSPKIHPAFVKPSATLQKMWVDYDVTENNEYGMRIHIALTIYDMKDIAAGLDIYFKYNNGQADAYMKDRNKRYATRSGLVTIQKDFIPTYTTSIYDDMQYFMPYDELDIVDGGTYDLTMEVQLHYKEGGLVAWLKQYDFEFSKADNARGNNTEMKVGSAKIRAIHTTGPRATYDTAWVEHNVTEGGVKGMRIHIKFTAYDMKDMEAYVAGYFTFNDRVGGPLKDKNQKYNSTAGDVAVYKSVTPVYNPAYFEDLQLFMPNDEFDLGPGSYKLTMEIKLIYKEGGLIQDLAYYDFDYDRAGDR